MFSRKDRGSGSSGGRFSEELSQLKRQGASVLVVGSVRADHRRSVCHRLMGTTSVQPRQRVLVSTTGNESDMSHLIDNTEDATGCFKRVGYAAQARSTAVSATGPNAMESAPPVIDDSTATTLADLGIAISSAIEAFETDADGLAPAELRVGVDSLVPLLEEYGTERVFKFAHLTNGRTRDADGMIHYHLPMDRDSDAVSVLAPLFDIIIELREQSDTFQERWSLNDGDHHSGWISIDQS